MTIAKLIERLRSPVFGTQTALEAADALASSQEEIARLRKALEPFALELGEGYGDVDDNAPFTAYFSVGQIRKAARALASKAGAA